MRLLTLLNVIYPSILISGYLYPDVYNYLFDITSNYTSVVFMFCSFLMFLITIDEVSYTPIHVTLGYLGLLYKNSTFDFEYYLTKNRIKS